MAEAAEEPVEEPIPAEDGEAEEAAADDGGDEEGGEDCPNCPPAGAPLWMATFADMMSLLLCFFVLILSFAEMNVPKYKQISGSLQSAFGIQRIVPVVEPPKAQSLIAKAFTPSVAQPTPVETIRQQTTDETQPDLEKKLETKTEDYPTPEEKAQLEQMLAEEIAKGQVEVRIEDQELVVEMKSPNITGGREAGDSGRMAGAPISREALNTYAKIAEAQSQMDRDLTVLAPEPTVASSQGDGDASGGPADGENAGGLPGSGATARAQMIFTPGSAPICRRKLRRALRRSSGKGIRLSCGSQTRDPLTQGARTCRPPFCPFSVGRDRPLRKAMAKSA